LNTNLPTHQRQQQVAVQHDPGSSIAALMQRREQIQILLKKVLKPSVHYDKTPGTDSKRMTLLKPGVEIILSTFMLRPIMRTQQTDLPGGHREYRCDIEIISSTGEIVSSGVGSCSTMESKYRWRYQDRACPKCGAPAIKKAKPEPGKVDRGFYCWDKLGGCGARFGPNDRSITDQKGGKVENPDISDQYNTVLKMAAKRALTHATLLATAASDMFDTEDEEPEVAGPQYEEPEDRPAPKPRMTQREELLQAVKAAAQALTDSGKEKEFLSGLIEAAGIAKPRTWDDLNDKDLKTILHAFRRAMEEQQ
jgi:hypothetical protein